MENCNYNIVQQLAKKLTFLWRIDQYIKDAEAANHTLCAAMWKQMKADEEKHVDMLRKAVEGLCKEGKLC